MKNRNALGEFFAILQMILEIFLWVRNLAVFGGAVYITSIQKVDM